MFSPGRGADRGNEIEERRKQKNATRKKKPNSEKIISLSLPFSLLSHPHKVHPAPDLEQAKPKVDPEQLRDLQTKPEPEIRDVKRLDRGQPDDEAVGAGLCRGARWEAAAVGRGEVQVGLDPAVVGKELGEVRQQPAGGVRDDDADLGEGAPVPVDAKVEAGAEERRRDAEAEEDLDDGADRLALSEGAVLTWGVWRWGEGRSFFFVCGGRLGLEEKKRVSFFPPVFFFFFFFRENEKTKNSLASPMSALAATVPGCVGDMILVPLASVVTRI